MGVSVRQRRGCGVLESAEPADSWAKLDGHVRQVVKRLWVYIKEHNLQNPKDRRKIVPDETLGRFCPACCTAATLPPLLILHPVLLL